VFLDLYFAQSSNQCKIRTALPNLNGGTCILHLFCTNKVTVHFLMQVSKSVKSMPTKHRQNNDTGLLISVDAGRTCQHKYDAQ